MGFSNSMEIAEQSFPAATLGTKAVIDYCFVTADTINVLAYRVDTYKVATGDPSDHSPVIVDYRFH